MVSAFRKINRKKKENLKKKVRKAMKGFKRLIKCSICDKTPERGEFIDKWNLEKYDNKMVLTCPDCVKNVSDEEGRDE